ncbi:MAG: hypothetical protein Q4D25_09225 [Bacteroidales bacterium]|nr:hypothetical protein [Bacteroidales bacterium]
MLLTLYDRYGNVKTTLSPDDSSRQVKEIQGDNVLTLTFTLYKYLNIDVNDYVDYLGERYWAKEKFLPNEKSTMEWSYNVKLYGIESLLTRFLVLKTMDGDVDPVFALTGRPIEHMRLIVANINAGMGSSDWNVGTVEGTENVVIDYTGKYCDEALKELAEAVGTEWWVEGNTVNLCRCEHGEEVTLSYGHGLTNLDRDVADNAKFYTRLFPIGSSKNIDPAQYGHSRLQLPNGAKYVDVNVEQYGIIHHYEENAFAGIYPRRVGKVSNVRHENAVDKDGKPFTIYYFKDNGLTFDPNDYEIGGLVKHVSFLDGSELSGLGIGDDHYFEVNYHSDTQEFEIITIWPYDDDTQLPGGQLVPAIDNEYILWNIRMPEEYYGMAEQEFKRAVDAYNAEHALDVSVYKAPTDHVWVEEQEAALPQDEDALLYVGRRVRLESDEYFPNTGYRSSRITRISRQVTLPSLMDLDISDALSRGTLEKIDDSIHDVKNYTDRMLKDANVPYIIKSWETIPPTDNNLFSARRVVKQFLDKLTTAVQEVWGRIIFKQKIIVEDDASVENSLEVGEELSVDRISSNEEDSVCVDDNLNVTGDTNMEGDAQIGGNTQQVGDLTFGSTDTNANTHYVQGVKGAKIYWNGSGWFVETDYLAVNKRMYAKSIQVDEVTHVGGENLLTEASCVADSVKEYSTFYRVFFRRKNGEGRTIFNQFRVGDQAYCQIFNIDAGESECFTNRYYWRLVVNTSNNTSASYDEETVTLMENFHFIDLSKSISDVSGDLRMDDHAGSVPKAEDPIVQLGYRRQAGDDDELVAERQGATLISGGGKYKRAIVMWEGINSFVLPNPRIFFSPNRVDMVVDSLKIRTAGTDKPVEQYVDEHQEQFEIFETETTDVPTLQNAPYTTWSFEERERYSTEPNNAVVLNADGRTWRFVKNGNSYAFEEFTDPWLLAQHQELKNILDDGVITQDELPQLQLTCNTIMSQCQKVMSDFSSSNATSPGSPLYTPYQNYISSYNVLCSSSQGSYGYFYEISGMTPPIYLQNYADAGVTKYRASRSDILTAIVTNALRYDEWNNAYAEWKAEQIAYAQADDALALAMEYVDDAIAEIDASTIDAQLANLINAYKNGNLATHSQLEATDQRVTAVTNWVGTDSTSFGSTGLLTHLRNLFVGTSSVVLDTEGYITNISKAGLVTSEQFAALGARVATAEGNIVSAATIAAWISDSFDSNSNAAKLKSHILITADDVKIESGNKSMGDYFSLMNGNLWCQNLTVAGVYNNLIDVIDWANGIGKDKIIIAYFSGTDGDGDVLAYSNSLGSIVDADSGEIVEPATLNYGSIRCYLDVMNCGDVLVIKSLPSVLQLNSDDQDGMLRLPFFIDSGIQERTYTRFNDSGIHLITPDELRMMVGKKMVIRTTINDTLYQQTSLKGQYHLTALDASARAIQTLVNGLPFYLDRPIGNNGEIRPDLVMADQRLNGPKTLFLEMKLCEFFSDTSITQASRKYGYAWCGQESYAGSALGEDIDVAWND